MNKVDEFVFATFEQSLTSVLSLIDIESDLLLSANLMESTNYLSLINGFDEIISITRFKYYEFWLSRIFLNSAVMNSSL